MSRLWNAAYRGIRYQVRPTYGAPLLEEDREQPRSLPALPKSIPSIPAICKDLARCSNQNNQDSNRFHRQNEPYLFLEICGISSAFTLGWQYYQPDQQKKDEISKKQSSLLKALVNVALAQPGVSESKPKLSILPEKPSPSTIINPAPQEKEQSSTTEQKTDSYNISEDEIHQTLVQLTQRLKQADDLLLGEWQNDAGVDLMTAAQSGGSCPKYDKLIHCSGDRPSRYLQEALNCFEESRKLGSVKGTFNLGLCYEQGLGTCINLQKASECYTEAAAQGHAKAQYNLSLLHYQQRLPSSDRIKAFKLMCSAADQGLQQAQSALQVMTLDPDMTPLPHRNSSCDSFIRNENRSPTFRKIRSEPHRMCLQETEEEEEEESHFSASVSFYVNGH